MFIEITFSFAYKTNSMSNRCMTEMNDWCHMQIVCLAAKTLQLPFTPEKHIILWTFSLYNALENIHVKPQQDSVKHQTTPHLPHTNPKSITLKINLNTPLQTRNSQCQRNWHSNIINLKTGESLVIHANSPLCTFWMAYTNFNKPNKLQSKYTDNENEYEYLNTNELNTKRIFQPT